MVINFRAVSSERYCAKIRKYTKNELKVIARKAQEIMTIKRMYHPQGDIDKTINSKKGTWTRTP